MSPLACVTEVKKLFLGIGRHLISPDEWPKKHCQRVLSVSLCTDQAGPFVIRDKKSQGGLVAHLAHKLGHRVCTTLPGIQTSFQEPALM